METLREYIICKQADTVKYQQRRAIHRMRKLVSEKSRVGQTNWASCKWQSTKKDHPKKPANKDLELPSISHLLLILHNRPQNFSAQKKKHLIFPQASELDWLSFLSAVVALLYVLTLRPTLKRLQLLRALLTHSDSKSVLQTSVLIMSTYIPPGPMQLTRPSLKSRGRDMIPSTTRLWQRYKCEILLQQSKIRANNSTTLHHFSKLTWPNFLFVATQRI